MAKLQIISASMVNEWNNTCIHRNTKKNWHAKIHWLHKYLIISVRTYIRCSEQILALIYNIIIIIYVNEYIKLRFIPCTENAVCLCDVAGSHAEIKTIFLLLVSFVPAIIQSLELDSDMKYLYHVEEAGTLPTKKKNIGKCCKNRFYWWSLTGNLLLILVNYIFWLCSIDNSWIGYSLEFGSILSNENITFQWNHLPLKSFLSSPFRFNGNIFALVVFTKISMKTSSHWWYSPK